MTDSKSMIDETKAVRDFRRLFERAAANGGEEKLFGRGSLAAALQVIQKSSLVGTDPVFFHLEVPLTGSPRMDLFLEYNCREIKSPVRFAQGDGFGWKPFLAECVNDKNLREYMFNFAFDLSEGKKQPNIYLIPLFKDANCDYIPAMLERMGIPERRERLMEAFAAAPAGWKPYYAGFLDMRPDSPIRFGFQIARERMEAYAEDVAIIDIHFTAMQDVVAVFEAEILCDVETSSEAIATIKYIMNNEEITDYHPVETWIDGKHILHLLYFIDCVALQLTHWQVRMNLTGGTATIGINQIRAVISGQGLMEVESWDGLIYAEDIIGASDVERELELVSFTDDADLDIVADVILSATDNMGAVALEKEPDDMDGITDTAYINKKPLRLYTWGQVLDYTWQQLLDDFVW